MADETGFETFLAARGAALLRFALMLCGDRHRAEDLVQGALAKLFPRWDRIAAMDHPEAYLKTVLVHDHLRWWRRRSAGELPVPKPTDQPSTADAAAEHAERDAAWRLLATLPRRQRAVLVLRYYEDMSDADIAGILDCEQSTVRSQATRALATLRAALIQPEKRRQPEKSQAEEARP